MGCWESKWGEKEEWPRRGEGILGGAKGLWGVPSPHLNPHLHLQEEKKKVKRFAGLTSMLLRLFPPLGMLLLFRGVNACLFILQDLAWVTSGSFLPPKVQLLGYPTGFPQH